MIIDDLNEVKKSLETTYKDFKKIKPYTLLKCVKKIIIDYKDEFTQKEILTFINNVFVVEIDYSNFNKFFITFCRNENKPKKKELKKVEKNSKKEDIKKDSSKDEPIKKSDDIVSKKNDKSNEDEDIDLLYESLKDNPNLKAYKINAVANKKEK